MIEVFLHTKLPSSLLFAHSVFIYTAYRYTYIYIYRYAAYVHKYIYIYVISLEMILILNFWREWTANLFLLICRLIIFVKSVWFGISGKSRGIFTKSQFKLLFLGSYTWIKGHQMMETTTSRCGSNLAGWKIHDKKWNATYIASLKLTWHSPWKFQWLKDDSCSFWGPRPILRGGGYLLQNHPRKTNGGCSPEAMIRFRFFFLGLLSGEPAVRFRGEDLFSCLKTSCSGVIKWYPFGGNQRIKNVQ